MKDKNMRDAKHKVERALRKAWEQKGLDYVEWYINEDDRDYIMSHYDVELLRYEVRRVARPRYGYRSSKSKVVKYLMRRKNPVILMELTPEQVAECRRAGFVVTDKVYRIRHQKKEDANYRGRRDGRRNIGKNFGCRR